jgi:enoyl-CoA hydratase/carnithine racemase
MTVRLEREGAVAHLIIDRPDKRNAFNQSMWLALPRLVEEADADETLKLILLRSSTPGMFCAGADIGELLAQKDNADWRSANQAAINDAQYVLTRASKPTIAFVDGDCIGGGCGLALACDIRVATPRSRFGITPAKLGLVYPLHDTKLLVDLVGPGQAKRMLFTGMLLSADEAAKIGLIEEIADDSTTLIESLTNASSHSARGVKGFIRRILDGQVADDVDTLDAFAEAFTLPDFLEGTTAFVEKRKPQFR